MKIWPIIFFVVMYFASIFTEGTVLKDKEKNKGYVKLQSPSITRTKRGCSSPERSNPVVTVYRSPSVSSRSVQTRSYAIPPPSQPCKNTKTYIVKKTPGIMPTSSSSMQSQSVKHVTYLPKQMNEEQIMLPPTSYQTAVAMPANPPPISVIPNFYTNSPQAQYYTQVPTSHTAGTKGLVYTQVMPPNPGLVYTQVMPPSSSLVYTQVPPSSEIQYTLVPSYVPSPANEMQYSNSRTVQPQFQTILIPQKQVSA